MNERQFNRHSPSHLRQIMKELDIISFAEECHCIRLHWYQKLILKIYFRFIKWDRKCLHFIKHGSGMEQKMLIFCQAWLRIGKTLVAQSKGEITADDACEKIRNILVWTEKVAL